MFLNFIPLCSIFSLAAILVESWDYGKQLWKDHSTKVWLKLAQWFLRRFLCAFDSALGAILVEGPNRRTHFWKRTIQ